MFTQDSVVITHGGTTTTTGGQVVAAGTKLPSDELWTILPRTDHTDIASQPQADQRINAVVRNMLDAEYLRWAHACLGSPAISTMQHAASLGWLAFLPRVTTRLITQNAPISFATAQGHLNQSRAGLNSTKSKPKFSFQSHVVTPPTIDPPGDSEDQNCLAIKLLETSATAHADMTGRFPVPSTRKNNYVLVGVFNGIIHAVSLKSRSASDLTDAHRRLVFFFRSEGHVFTAIRLDNETSKELTSFFVSENIDYQYVPPNNHRANKAERAIGTWKEHFISILSTAPTDTPLALWDDAIDHANLTLSLLQAWQPDPTKSAYEGFHGKPFDYQRHPFAIWGMKVLIHETPSNRSSFAPHGLRGIYLGPSFDHYRSHIVFVIATQTTRISDTLAWFPGEFQMPGSTPVELLQAAIVDLKAALIAVNNTDMVAAQHHQPFADKATTATDTLIEAFSLFHGAPADSPTAGPEQRVVADTPLPPFPSPTSEPAVQRVPAAATPTAVPIAPSHANVSTTGSMHKPRTRPAKKSIATVPLVAPATPAAHVGTPSEDSRAPAQSVTPTTTTSPRKPRKRPPAKPKQPRPVPTIPFETFADRQRTDKANLARPPSTTPPISRTGNRSQTATAHSIFHGKGQHYAGNIQGAAPHAAKPAPRSNLVEVIDHDQTSPPNMRAAMRGPDRNHWKEAELTELLNLLPGGTDTMKFILHSEKPKHRQASYYNPQPKLKSVFQVGADGVQFATYQYRVRGTYGGNLSDYTGEVTANTADMTTIKVLLNDIISTPGASSLTADISNFYLNNDLEYNEYMTLTSDQVPQAIREKFNLTGDYQDTNGRFMVEIKKGLYGMPQAGKLARDNLVKLLADNDYEECSATTGLFKHKHSGVAFTLVVDDFLIKYLSKDSADHLLSVLKQKYKITEDWSTSKYIGITIDIDRKAGTLTTSIPHFVSKAMSDLGVVKEPFDTHSPAQYQAPHFGSTDPQMTAHDTSPLLPAEGVKWLQSLVGKFQYYSRALDCTLFAPINMIAAIQNHPTENVLQRAHRFIQCAATYPDAMLVYHASDMQLRVSSDASYLSEPKSRSRAGGVHYLSNHNDDLINGAIEVMSQVIKSVVSGAMEAEYAALFMNGKIAESIRNTLDFLGYPQQATSMVSDNLNAVGVANRTVKQRHSKAMDMRFHWIRDRADQGHFRISWAPGPSNLADYFTKVHPVKHYKAMRRIFVSDPLRT